MTYYKMGHGIFVKGFCKTCGVPIDNNAVSMSEEEGNALPEADKSWYDRGKIYRGLNANVLDGVDLTKLEKERADGWNNILPKYENP